MLPEKPSVNKIWRNVVLLLLLLGIPGVAVSQPGLAAAANAAEHFRGLPIIQNFNPKEYLHLTPHFEHTSIIQGKEGVMYIASQGGVLLYNGSSWQFVEVPGKDMVWSLCLEASSDRIYLGASDNLGYLETDSSGKKRFVSLLPHLPKEVGAIGIVWATIVTPDGVYFKTNHYLMRWHQDQFKVWKADEAFGGVYHINQKLYVHQPNKGLFVLQNDKLELFSNDKAFSAEIPQFLMPLSPDRWLLTTNSGGLYQFDGRQTAPVNGAAVSFLLNNWLFSGTVLPDGNIALATLRGGVVIADQQLNIKRIINKESGLPTNTVYLLSTDKQGGLWVSSEKGLSRLRLNAPFSYFNEQNGLQRQTYAVQLHEGRLYAGTTDGLFVLEEKAPFGVSATFKKVAGFGASIWNIQSLGTSLFLASEEGLFEWRGGNITSLKISDHPWNNYCRDAEPSILDTSLVYAAGKGLHTFKRKGEAWQYQGSIAGLEEEDLTQILQMPEGDLWLPIHSGLVRLRFPSAQGAHADQDFFTQATVERFGEKQGIPAGTLRLYRMGEQLIAQAGEVNYKLFRFREELNRFEPISNFAEQLGLAGQLAHPAMEYNKEQQLWLWTKNKEDQRWKLALAAKQAGGAYTLSTYDFSGITDPFKRFMYQQQNDGTVWYAGVDGLVRFEQSGAKVEKHPFPTLLERVVLSGNSVVFPQSKAAAVFPFENNSLGFEFAAPSYNGADENKFQYWLEGYDEGWSAWSSERFKEYTRIPEGTYTLHARALSAQGEIGEPVAYAFTILPPWYRAGYMYVLYVLLFLGGVWILVRWRSSQLRAEKMALESLVAQRTTELAQKNRALSEQSEALAQQAEKLKELDGVKSRFFANISHEFRTPLSLILNNLLDKLAATERSPEQTQVPVAVSDLNVMSRNARRLLQLINQLLDLSKVESGNMQLELQNGDLQQLIRLIFASFSSLATAQQINFQLRLPEDPLLCMYDVDKVEKILYNLLSNAFKFTPAQGTVVLEVKLLPAHGQQQSSLVQISLQDSGPGIPADQLMHVFNRFYQGKQYYADAQGTGIGLALTKELVELHQGHISVESRAGEGSCFMVQLPYIPATAGIAPGADGHSASALAYQMLTLPAQQAEQQEALASVAATGQEEQPLVLVVEDNVDLRNYIKRQLEGSYRVLECVNGAQGLAKALEVVPDLIISDWMMPEMDGLALCQQLKGDERTSHIPLIMLTALATTDAKLQGLENGADEYLTKPFDAREFHVRIQNLLENRRKLREHFSRVLRLEPTQLQIASADEKFLRRMMQIVEARMTDSEFSIEEFSREAGLSRVHLHRKLKALTGQAPSDFVRMMRLKQAAQLLQARAGNVAEIAYQVGFNNLSYFSKCFREEFGTLPNEYASRKAAPM
ncbi:ATP-binding protein [Cesiribacter sp. SM1]|uniref:hybrid sensor histidine kinase/response regulator transcription factor n=1 Tax=Cesiribacter sp. SM1 TaxID=2861196 RepID=UPI001CD66B90|nr:ATP-binding protein [Cesiribacter sp. SM1]